MSIILFALHVGSMKKSRKYLTANIVLGLTTLPWPNSNLLSHLEMFTAEKYLFRDLVFSSWDCFLKKELFSVCGCLTVETRRLITKKKQSGFDMQITHSFLNRDNKWNKRPRTKDHNLYKMLIVFGYSVKVGSSLLCQYLSWCEWKVLSSCCQCCAFLGPDIIDTWDMDWAQWPIKMLL